MKNTINVRAEVESLYGRALTASESRTFQGLRRSGFMNPYDIKREIDRVQADKQAARERLDATGYTI